MAELFHTSLFSDSNLKGYWRLESNFTDSSSSGYNLTGNNAPTDVTGKFGNGKSFAQSSSQSATIADGSCPNLKISGSQTWGCWHKRMSGQSNFLMGKSDSPQNFRKYIGETVTNQLQFSLAGLTAPVITSDVTPSDGVWYFVCGVYDSANSLLKLWVNGTKKEVASSGTVDTSAGGFALAREGDSVTHTFYANGVIDDAFMFNRALTDSEVSVLYQDAGASFLLNLV